MNTFEPSGRVLRKSAPSLYHGRKWLLWIYSFNDTRLNRDIRTKAATEIYLAWLLFSLLPRQKAANSTEKGAKYSCILLVFSIATRKIVEIMNNPNCFLSNFWFLIIAPTDVRYRS